MSFGIRICVGVWAIAFLCACFFSQTSGGKPPPFNFEEFQRTMMEDWANVNKFPRITLSTVEKAFVEKLLVKLFEMGGSNPKPSPAVSTKTTAPFSAAIKSTSAQVNTGPETAMPPINTQPETAMPPINTQPETAMPPINTQPETAMPPINTATTKPPIPSSTTRPPTTTAKPTTTAAPTTTKLSTLLPTTTKTTVAVPTTRTTTPVPTTAKPSSAAPTSSSTVRVATSPTTAPPVAACRTRVEFRLWSLEQFKNFSDAMVALQNKVIDQATGRTVYQLFIGNHRSSMAPGAHNGPCFLTWHAIYLILFELALQEENPTVCIPYNDWRADFEMTNQCQTSMYTAQYFGNDQGQVTTGFCANRRAYPAADCGGSDLGAYLTRRCTTISASSYGVNYAGWRNIYNVYQEYSDVCKPWNDNMEDNHNMLHASKGGHLGAVSCAVNDPVFWLIHCFVDMYWNSMRNKSSDPAQQLGTYPKASNGFSGIPANQNYNDQALPFTNWTCEMGLEVTSRYGVKYVTIPDTCSQDADCNHTPNNPQAFYCPSTGRCTTKSRIGGSCRASNQCFREVQCTAAPTCTNSRCQCSTTTTG